jgi:hypothetical protein
MNSQSIFLILLVLYVAIAGPLFLSFSLGDFGKGIPLTTVIVTFPVVCLTASWILEKKYQKHIKPVNERIKTLIHDKPPLFPPKSVLVMYKDIKAAGERIALIRKRMTKTLDYIAMLAHDRKNGSINGMISKQNDYYNYLFNYYDTYCSLYLEMRFQFYMAVTRDVLIAVKKIYTIDIKRFVDTMKTDIKCMGYTLDSKYYLAKRPGTSDYSSDYSEQKFFSIIERFEILTDLERTIATFFNDDNTDKKSKKQSSDQSEKYDMVLKKTRTSIKSINEKIQETAAYLITVQSSKIIGDTSPIDEENILNMQKQKNDFDIIIEYSKTLDDEYNRFIAEVELSENNSK